MTFLRRLWSVVPSGGSLPESVWRSRHRFLVGLTFFHVVVIALAGVLLGKRWELGLAGFIQDDNGLHVIGGLLFMGAVAGVIGGSGSRAPAGETMEVCGYYWHFVDVVWVAMFTTLYLLR